MVKFARFETNWSKGRLVRKNFDGEGQILRLLDLGDAREVTDDCQVGENNKK